MTGGKSTKEEQVFKSSRSGFPNFTHVCLRLRGRGKEKGGGGDGGR